MHLVAYLTKSTNPAKKYQVVIFSNKRKVRTIHFGAAAYSDYTMHRNEQRKINYLARHRIRENWTKSGIYTSGWWSRWLLWNQPTLASSIKFIRSRFGIIVRQRAAPV
jgi:hypothetical protein